MPDSSPDKSHAYVIFHLKKIDKANKKTDFFHAFLHGLRGLTWNMFSGKTQMRRSVAVAVDAPSSVTRETLLLRFPKTAQGKYVPVFGKRAATPTHSPSTESDAGGFPPKKRLKTNLTKTTNKHGKEIFVTRLFLLCRSRSFEHLCPSSPSNSLVLKKFMRFCKNSTEGSKRTFL